MSCIHDLINWPKCSQGTALRDIADLVARGILAKEPGGGRSTSYILEINPIAKKHHAI